MSIVSLINASAVHRVARWRIYVKNAARIFRAADTNAAVVMRFMGPIKWH